MSNGNRIGVMDVAKFREGKCGVIWHDKPLTIGEVVWVNELFTDGPGYEAKVVRALCTRKTLGGETITDYLAEPTGRVKKKVAYCR